MEGWRQKKPLKKQGEIKRRGGGGGGGGGGGEEKEAGRQADGAEKPK